jgi:hypothetical protein
MTAETAKLSPQTLGATAPAAAKVTARTFSDGSDPRALTVTAGIYVRLTTASPKTTSTATAAPTGPAILQRRFIGVLGLLRDAGDAEAELTAAASDKVNPAGAEPPTSTLR